MARAVLTPNLNNTSSAPKGADVLGDAPQLDPAHCRYRILALSGGGYRSLFTARILAKLEDHIGRPLNQAFDLIAGTSIGGILAGGLAVGISAAKLADSLQDRGSV
ncbi:MAG TPA: hypothetical protein ENJ35_07945, partial [Gammaproteobacteria bacterium]|nr:hypothetical protein [Gammaproteobacteria bacterium]